MAKYEKIGSFLEKLVPNRMEFSFVQLEELIEGKLPPSARKYKAWWGNTKIPGRQSENWLKRNWMATDVDLVRERVAFTRFDPMDGEAAASRLMASPPQEQPKFNSISLQNSDFFAVCSVGVKLNWKRLGSVVLTGGKLRFPAAPNVAGIYRMKVIEGSLKKIYIGEAVNLSRRFGNYRNPGNTQQTSLRINAMLRSVLSGTGTVTVDIAFDDVRLEIDGMQSAADLSVKSVRRLVEHAAIVALGGVDVEMLNR